MELVDYFRAGVAVTIFIAGFLLSRFVEKRKNRNQLKRTSVEAILPLLAAWQGKLADVTQSGLKYGLESDQYEKALHEFQKASSIANELEMHVFVLKQLGGCEDLVDAVYSLFGNQPHVHIDDTVSMQLRHGFLPVLMESYVKTIEQSDEKYIEEYTSKNDWRKDAIMLDFERWSFGVQKECGRVLSSL